MATHLISPLNPDKTVCGHYIDTPNSRGRTISVVTIATVHDADCKTCNIRVDQQVAKQKELTLADETRATRSLCACCARPVTRGRTTWPEGKPKVYCNGCFRVCRVTNTGQHAGQP